MVPLSKLLLISICALFLAALACKLPSISGGNTGTSPAPSVGSGNSNTATASNPAPVSAGITAADKPLDVLTKAISLQQKAKSWRLHIDLSGGVNSSSDGEFIAPDRLHTTTRMQMLGQSHNSEMIAIGKDAWVKRNGGTWQKSPMDPSMAFAQMNNKKLDEELAKVKDISLVGPDTVDGTPTLAYQYTVNDQENEMTVDVKVWVAVGDGLIRKMEITDKADKTHQVATISDYNADIKIEPPM